MVVIIDIETTGLNPYYARIVEVGAVRIVNKKIMGRFQAMIWPGIDAFKLPGVQDALIIQGRKVDDFRGGFDEDTTMEVLRVFINDDVVISYNSGFEKKFLKSWINEPKDFQECVMINASNVMGAAGSKYCPWNVHYANYKWPKLQQAAEFFEVQYNTNGGHSALHDAEVAARIHLKMKEVVE